MKDYIQIGINKGLISFNEDNNTSLKINNRLSSLRLVANEFFENLAN